MNDLPGGYSIHPVSIEDAGRIAELINDDVREEIGDAWTTSAEVRDDLTAPGRDLQTDTMFVLDAAGSPAAFLQMYADPPYTDIFAPAYVHPRHVGEGLGAFLLRSGESNIQEKIANEPSDQPVVMRVSRFPGNVRARTLFEMLGFSYARTFRMMRMELHEKSVGGMAPQGILVRRFDRLSDTRACYEALAEAFTDHWGQVFPPFELWHHYSFDGESAGFDPDLWLVATEGDEIVGAACSRANTGRGSRTGFVDDLGVRRPWRRRGVGMALLLATFDAFRMRGLERAELSVDAESLTGATRLYERAGMNTAFTWESWQKQLRVGSPQ